MNMFGIRNKATGKVDEKTFDNPILAEQEIIRKQVMDEKSGNGKKANAKPEYEIVERSISNVYRQFPDGNTYIVGTETVWQPYELKR